MADEKKKPGRPEERLIIDDPEGALDAILKGKEMQDELERKFGVPLKVTWQDGDTPTDELRARVGHPQEPVHVTLGGETDWFIIKGVTTGGSPPVGRHLRRRAIAPFSTSTYPR